VAGAWTAQTPRAISARFKISAGGRRIATRARLLESPPHAAH
jgi:hypothetical protein